MSHILDALKRAEQERLVGQAPGLHDAIIHNNTGHKRSWPKMAIFIALLVNAAVLSIFAYHWLPLGGKSQQTLVTNTIQLNPAPNQRTNTPMIPNPIMTAKPGIQPELRSYSNATVTPLPPAETVSVTAAPAADNNAWEPLTSAEGSIAVAHMDTQIETIPIKPYHPATSLSTEQLKEVVDEKPEADIPSLSQLPLSVRTNIPALELAALLYSQQAESRMVFVNGELMREGYAINESITLKRIEPQTVIFSYKGQLFSLGVL